MATKWQPACNQRRTHPELGALRLVLRVDTEHDELYLAVVLLG